MTDTYYKERHPVRQIPTREQIAHSYTRSTKRQQYSPPQRDASEHHTGHSSGFHPENEPHISEELRHVTRSQQPPGDYELEEADEFYSTRPHTSTRRYTQIPTTKGKVNVVEHYHDEPLLRAHRQQLAPASPASGSVAGRPPRQPERYIEEVEQIYIPRRRMHPLLWIGIFGICLVLGWIALNSVTSWYQGVQNDWTYGKDRHFEINAVVGHNNDSAAHPSHFTAENNNGQIIVIELPGGNVSKAKIYQIEQIPGNTGNPPVKLAFQDVNGDGKPDMIVMIGDGNAIIYLTLLNNGTQFVSKL